jgi:hypothetical protein
MARSAASARSRAAATSRALPSMLAAIPPAPAGAAAAQPQHPRLEKQILVVAGVRVRDPVVGRGVPRTG